MRAVKYFQHLCSLRFSNLCRVLFQAEFVWPDGSPNQWGCSWARLMHIQAWPNFGTARVSLRYSRPWHAHLVNWAGSSRAGLGFYLTSLYFLIFFGLIHTKLRVSMFRPDWAKLARPMNSLNQAERAKHITWTPSDELLGTAHELP